MYILGALGLQNALSSAPLARSLEVIPNKLSPSHNSRGTTKKQGVLTIPEAASR